MIDKSIIDAVLVDYPQYQYQLQPVGEHVELSIEMKEEPDKYGSYRCRKIKKKISGEEDLSVLRNVLKGKES